MSQDAAADIAELRELADTLEAARSSAPPGYRPAYTLAIKYARDMADAVEDGDPEGIEDATRQMSHGPKWLGPHMSTILTFLRVEGDPPQAVWIRWDMVPVELREATASLGSFIVDAVRGRWSPGGRPAK